MYRCVYKSQPIWHTIEKNKLQSLTRALWHFKESFDHFWSVLMINMHLATSEYFQCRYIMNNNGWIISFFLILNLIWGNFTCTKSRTILDNYFGWCSSLCQCCWGYGHWKPCDIVQGQNTCGFHEQGCGNPTNLRIFMALILLTLNCGKQFFQWLLTTLCLLFIADWKCWINITKPKKKDIILYHSS